MYRSRLSLVFGAIAGDVIGSIYEAQPIKTIDFELFNRFSKFTDDTVLTIAVADAILNRRAHAIRLIEDRLNRSCYARRLRHYGRRFPHAGYGEGFKEWLRRNSSRGYRSYANGAAMRVSPVGFAFQSMPQVLHEAKLSAMVTHNHPQGIRGAQAIASAVFLARTGKDKPAIREFVERKFHYDLSQRLDDIRPAYAFDSSSRGSVPQALTAFLESEDFEDALRKAISLGGDSDTIACMAGGIAQAYYRVIPSDIAARVALRLDASFRDVMIQFNTKFGLTDCGFPQPKTVP